MDTPRMLISYKEFRELNKSLKFFTEGDAEIFYEALYMGDFRVAIMLLYHALDHSVGYTFLNKRLEADLREICGKYHPEECPLGELYTARLDDFVVQVSSLSADNASLHFLLSDFLVLDEKKKFVELAKSNEIFSILAYLVSNNRAKVIDLVEGYVSRLRKGKGGNDFLDTLVNAFMWNEFLKVNSGKTFPEDFARLFSDLQQLIDFYYPELYTRILFLEHVLSMDSSKVILSRMHFVSLSARGEYGYELLLRSLRRVGELNFLRLLDIIS